MGNGSRRATPTRSFTPRACVFRTRRWRDLGYHPGQSLLRECSYRKCRKGPGGARNTFIRAYRRGSGFFCDGRCNAAERRCRKDDELARLKAAEQKSEKKRRGDSEGKITLLVRLLDEGAPSLNAVRLQIFPETPATAYINLRQMFRRNRTFIQKLCKPETVVRLPQLFKESTVT